MELRQFTTRGIQGEDNSFQYSVAEENFGKREVSFYIYSIPPDPNRFFSYDLVVEEDYAKNKMITANEYKEFRQKGIPERIIEIACEYLEMNIHSSPLSNGPDSGDYVVPNARKAWDRLVSQNENARLDKENDRYVLEFRK